LSVYIHPLMTLQYQLIITEIKVFPETFPGTLQGGLLNIKSQHPPRLSHRAAEKLGVIPISHGGIYAQISLSYVTLHLAVTPVSNLIFPHVLLLPFVPCPIFLLLIPSSSCLNPGNGTIIEAAS